LKDAKNAEKKLRELAGWLTYVEEAQSEVGLGLQHMCDVKSEVDKQKAVCAELDMKKGETLTAREVMAELQVSCQDAVRQAGRGEEKLQHLRKNALQRQSESKHTIEGLHSKCLSQEGTKRQLHVTLERNEAEVAIAQRACEVEKRRQEQEVADMKNCYYRLEGVVISHLQKLQVVVNENSSNNSNNNSTNNYTQSYNKMLTATADTSHKVQAHMAVV